STPDSHDASSLLLTRNRKSIVTRWNQDRGLAVLGLTLVATYSLAHALRSDTHRGPTRNHVSVQSDRSQFAVSGMESLSGRSVSASDRDDLGTTCRRRAAAWRSQLGDNVRVVISPPFVLVGFESRDALDRIASETLQPAARDMILRFGWPEPNQPISLLLLPDEPTYRRIARHVFDVEPGSIFGFYWPSERTIVANLAAGDGTILHEVTHALLDFEPWTVPTWFHEGLASSHEESSLSWTNGRASLRPRDNWRLPFVTQALREDSLPSIQELLTTSPFRGNSEAVDYATARYLCIFLHEHELLAKFYKQWRGARESDPTGWATLQDVWSIDHANNIDLAFHAWVLSPVRQQRSLAAHSE
ncbi:MAG TPA: hypothetical protein VIY86_07275, partial [Pirellulaceae bacterium]